MVLNGGSLADCFVRRIEEFRVGALEKVVMAFNSIAEESNAVAEKEFERLGSMPAYDEDAIDMGTIAELANESGIEYYETMSGIRQVVLNLLAVGLHHLFEQQQCLFLRELARGEEGAHQAADLERRLADLGIDCQSFGCAGKLYELRKAANAIKHGAGPSAEELATLRPDLFKDPVLVGIKLAQKGISGLGLATKFVSSLFVPLAGKSLYVSEHDLSDWCAAVSKYWKELSRMLGGQHHRTGRIGVRNARKIRNHAGGPGGPQ